MVIGQLGSLRSPQHSLPGSLDSTTAPKLGAVVVLKPRPRTRKTRIAAMTGAVSLAASGLRAFMLCRAQEPPVAYGPVKNSGPLFEVLQQQKRKAEAAAEVAEAEAEAAAVSSTIANAMDN